MLHIRVAQRGWRQIAQRNSQLRWVHMHGIQQTVSHELHLVARDLRQRFLQWVSGKDEIDVPLQASA